MELNLQAPYKIERQQDGKYTFVTISGVVYIAYFIEIPFGNGIEDVYSFSFETINEPQAFDERIYATIFQILHEFFLNNQNSMLFVCDSNDDKESARLRLFDRWYKDQEVNDFILKYDKSVKLPDFDLHSSILINKKNPLKDQILLKFNEYIDLLKY